MEKTKRIVIPPQFRTYAGITIRVTVLGLGDRLEIWDTTHWQEYRSGLVEQARESMPELPQFPLES